MHQIRIYRVSKIPIIFAFRKPVFLFRIINFSCYTDKPISIKYSEFMDFVAHTNATCSQGYPLINCIHLWNHLARDQNHNWLKFDQFPCADRKQTALTSKRKRFAELNGWVCLGYIWCFPTEKETQKEPLRTIFVTDITSLFLMCMDNPMEGNNEALT